jgi:DNA (cytosine-5)-methyltransferase 1
MIPGAGLTWYAETDPDANAVMAAHHGGTPNLGDVTTIDWSTVAPVDILSAGFPCQPFSVAGRRRGSSDSRNLWLTGVQPAIATLGPPVVALENVPGLLTIESGAVFRRILTDLDTLGYTTRWTVVGSCKVGACHHRHRVFILATRMTGELPNELGMPLAAWASWPRDGMCCAGMAWAMPSDVCGAAGIVLPTPCTSDGGSRGTGLGTYSDPAGRPLREVVAMLPTPTSSDGTGGAGHDGREGAPNLRTAVTRLSTPGASVGVKGDPSGDLALPAVVRPERWGRWAEAVTRHEMMLGRPVPAPTIIGRRGGLRLNPSLTEWMMCFPEGWITGVVASPNACNRLAGNSVNPLQGAEAFRRLGLVETDICRDP